jgi:predicted transcriptional regulator
MVAIFRKNQPDSHLLGPLEIEVMDIIWGREESAVRDVVDRLERSLAYTTVMTTLDRLYKKNLLKRRMGDRAFLYSAVMTRAEWEQKRAGAFVAGLLAAPEAGREMLISCLVDAVGHDERLLDELEKKIRQRRKELKQS